MTKYTGLTIELIKTAANGRMEDVLAALKIHERPRPGGYIHICDPTGDDKTPSFTIWTKGGFLTFERHGTNYKGDVFGLVAYLNGWFDLPKKGLPEACRWLTQTLGLERVERAQLDRDLANARQRQEDLGKRTRQQAERNALRAFELFLAGKPVLGTPVEIYLRARGIDLRALPAGPRGGERLPHILRYLPEHEHAESGKRFPCMLAACVGPEGNIRAVHRTWLARDGSDKAPVEPQRKVWPGFAGLVMPVWRGETRLSIKEAIAAGLRETLVLTEGIEDALSAVTAAPQHRTWAFISLGNLRNVMLPECIDGVMLHRQNEWSNRQAVKAFEAGKAALEAQGRPVAEVRAFHGKDLNDTLRGEVAR